MKQWIRSRLAYFQLFGIDPAKFRRTVRLLPQFRKELHEFRRQSRGENSMEIKVFPYLEDRNLEAGEARGHYFHQDLLVARKVFEAKPERHVDVGSRIDGFVAHVAVFREIEVFDIRPLNTKVPNIRFRQVDVMDPDQVPEAYCDSLSCLHALEHFGLGRYSDPIRVDGHLLAMQSLRKMLRKGGVLYLSVPIGPPRVEFNGQRVFAVRSVLDQILQGFSLKSFSLIDDSGELIVNYELDPESVDSNCWCHLGCGVFEAVLN